MEIVQEDVETVVARTRSKEVWSQAWGSLMAALLSWFLVCACSPEMLVPPSMPMYTLLYIVGVAGTFLQPVMVVAAWGFGLGAFVRAFSRPKSISKAISPSKWLILPLWIFTSGVALAALGLQIRLLIASSV